MRLTLQNGFGNEEFLAENFGAGRVLIDFQAGRPLEIEAIWGEPLRRAAAAGAPTPRLQDLYEKLKRIDSRRGARMETQAQVE